MEIKQTKELLRGSLELKVLWRTPVLVAVVFIPVLLFTALTRGGFDRELWITAGIVGGLMLLPTAGFALIRTIQIFRKPEAYFVCRATLCQPHGGPVRYSIYYTTLVEDPENGDRFIVNTHAIFVTHGGMGPTIEEYTNSSVSIAYNRETGMVVVIG